MENKAEHRKASVYTAITLVSVLLFLFLFGFRVIIPDAEEGLLVDFGTKLTGSGNIEPAPSVTAPSAQPVAPTVTPAQSKPQPTSAKEDLKTQNFEEAPVVESGKRKQETPEEKAAREAEIRKQQLAEAEARKRREAIAAEVARQEELDRQRKAEEARLEQARLERERQANEIRQRTQNAFGGGAGTGTTTNQGAAGGTGNQGNPNGAANTGNYTGSGLGNKGNGYSLSGRSLVGSLPEPAYNVQEEGIVVVQIEVDKNGNVISATPILKGSTTSDAELWRVAREAALKARFNADPTAATKQVGTITYHFRLD